MEMPGAQVMHANRLRASRLPVARFSRESEWERAPPVATLVRVKTCRQTHSTPHHSRAVPSAEVEAKRKGTLDTWKEVAVLRMRWGGSSEGGHTARVEILRISCLCPCRVRLQQNVSMSHTRMVLSRPPESSRSPAAARQRTLPRWPRRVPLGSRVAGSITRIMASPPQLQRYRSNITMSLMAARWALTRPLATSSYAASLVERRAAACSSAGSSC
mmetsp:Transcript_27807/g.78638  ORF Transcript_27807/g.78638 Transcript_27807/m.78638 type:complete len:216 (+) Transcript_27807:2007-2654(+)